MNKFKAILTAACFFLSAGSLAQSVDERLEALGGMIPAHPGQLGALAPENLNKDRPAPPFDLTGTWFVDLSGGFGDFMFGSQGYPEFIGQAAIDFETGQQARANGEIYSYANDPCLAHYDDSGAYCYLYGVQFQ